MSKRARTGLLAIVLAVLIPTLGSTAAAASSPTPVGDATVIGGVNTLFRLESDGLWWDRFHLPGVDPFDPTWSPDGSKVAYLDNDETEIRWADYQDQGRNGQILATAGSHLQDITWSGDGSTLYFVEQTGAGFARLMAVRAESGWTPYQVTPLGDNTHNYWGVSAARTGQVVMTQETYPTGANSIYLYDPAHPGLTLLMSNVGDAAISGDGTRLAWSIQVNGDYQIFVGDLHGGNAVQVTSGDTTHGGPRWSPDGKTIMFNELLHENAIGEPTDGVYDWLASVPSNGSGAANPTVYFGQTGMMAYEPMNVKDNVVIAGGSDRYATAVAISQTHWATAGAVGDARQAAQSVVLTRGDLFADALSAEPLAADKVGPLLTTPPGSLDSRTKSEIARVLGSNHAATVYLIGSTGAISATTESAIRAMGYQTVRLSGVDRYATSVAVAGAISANPSLVLAATGTDFPDALAAGAAAGAYNVPGTDQKAVVVLTDGGTASAPTAAYLVNWTTAHHGDAAYALFGIGASGYEATTPYGATALYGATRYDTADDIDTVFFGAPLTVGATPGSDWPDALAGGALMGTLDGPLVLTNPNAGLTDSPQGDYLNDRSGSISTVMQFGQTTPAPATREFGPLVSGPGGWTSVTDPTSPIGATLTTPAAAKLRTPTEAVQAAESLS